jgi:hypothetical protein
MTTRWRGPRAGRTRPPRRHSRVQTRACLAAVRENRWAVSRGGGVSGGQRQLFVSAEPQTTHISSEACQPRKVHLPLDEDSPTVRGGCSSNSRRRIRHLLSLFAISSSRPISTFRALLLLPATPQRRLEATLPPPGPVLDLFGKSGNSGAVVFVARGGRIAVDVGGGGGGSGRKEAVLRVEEKSGMGRWIRDVRNVERVPLVIICPIICFCCCCRARALVGTVARCQRRQSR